MTIRLDSIKKVKEFVEITNHYEGKIEISSGTYTVDGKSIMGIFSLELRKNLSMEIEERRELSSFMKELKSFIVT